MELSKKVKVALDETRMLILGAQILLGFQFRGVFGDGYDQLVADSLFERGSIGIDDLCCRFTDHTRSLSPDGRRWYG